MDWLSQLQGVEGGTQAESDTWSQLLRVGKGSQTGVSDLGLDESGLVQSVLGSELNVDVGGLDGVPGGLSTNLNQWRNLVEVGGREDRKVGGGGSSQRVVEVGVTETDGVLVNLGGSNVVTKLSTGGETVVGNGQVSGSQWALQQVEEQSGVDSRLRVEEVQLSSSRAVWNHAGVQLTLETWSQQLRELKLGVQGIGVVPTLGEGQAGRLVSVLSVDRGGNGLVLGGLTLDGEGDTVRSNRLHIHRSSGKVEEVLVEEIVSQFLDVGVSWWRHCVLMKKKNNSEIGCLYTFFVPCDLLGHVVVSGKRNSTV